MSRMGLLRKRVRCGVAGLLLAALLAGTLGGCAGRTEVMVFCGASVAPEVEALAVLYREMTGQTVTVHAAASGTLRKQIEQGAPADLFLSGTEMEMIRLQEGGLLWEDTYGILLENRLVFAEGPGGPGSRSLDDFLAGGGRVALGDPAFVAGGAHAMHLLIGRGWEERLEGKQILARDMRQVVAYLRSGEVEGGFVFETELVRHPELRAVEAFDPAETGEIRYPIARLRDSVSPGAAGEFLEFLGSEEAAEVFREAGYRLPFPGEGE